MQAKAKAKARVRTLAKARAKARVRTSAKAKAKAKSEDKGKGKSENKGKGKGKNEDKGKGKGKHKHWCSGMLRIIQLWMKKYFIQKYDDDPTLDDPFRIIMSPPSPRTFERCQELGMVAVLNMVLVYKFHNQSG